MAEFNPAASQIEWHMQQLRQWMVPTSVPASQKTSPVAPIHTFPQDYYVQNVPPSDLYDFDVFNDVGPSVNALQRSHTFNNLNDYHFNHDPFQVHHNPMTIANYFGEETGNTDDVVSIYSDAPSSYLSSDLSDQPRVDTHLSPSRNTPPVFQQPFSLAGSAPESTSEVDSLMKTLRPLTSHPQAESAVKNKRHVCPYSECGKLFSQPTHLKIHLRSHTGEKPYTCSFAACRQAFSQLGNLRTHERRHVGQRPNRRRTSSDPGQRPKRYECRLDGCKATNEDGNQGKVFTQLGNLKAHMNKFHKETLARLSEQFAMSTDDEEEQELRRYFQDLYKHSNKGIKGRGKGRKVEVIMPSDQG